jgi:hypothetical protein
MAFADHFEAPEPKLGNGMATFARHVWLFIVLALTVPVLAAWIIRGAFAVLGCEPAAAACLEDPANAIMGSALKATLDIAWLMGTTDIVTLGLTTLAAMAAIIGLRPIHAGLTVLIVPLAALLLPVWLVSQTAYSGCAVSEGRVGDCVLWGTHMSDTFHAAATAPALIYTYTPFAVAGALVAGLLGLIVYWGARQMANSRAQQPFKRTAAPRSPR